MQINSSSGTHYIDGHFIKGAGVSFISCNPVTGETLWEGQKASEPEVHAAFYAAHRASLTWAQLGLDKRINYLKQFEAVVNTKKKPLAKVISEETGKPYWEALTEAQAVIQKIDLSIKAYQARTAEQVVLEKKRALRYKPHGVVAVIGPFNFPAHLSNGHIVPALLAGNTIVYKPSEETPLVAEFIIKCWHESTIPPGVINLVQGGAETAEALIACNIRALLFTGSYKTGLSIHQALSMRPEVLLALEMGGNNPLVVDKKLQDIPAAVYHTLLSAFLTAGQRCTAARRLIIPKSESGAQFLDALVTATKQLVIGAPFDKPEPFMGPVIAKSHAQKHANAAKYLISLGAKPLLPMEQLAPDSAFLSPGIFMMDDVSFAPDEEIFAPLLQVYTYRDLNEAVMMANNTKYGLAAGLLGGSKGDFEYFYQHVNAGHINWNRPTTGASSELPFGGIGCSGNHRPSAYFAADYVATPIASLETDDLCLDEPLLPGIHLEERPE